MHESASIDDVASREDPFVGRHDEVARLMALPPESALLVLGEPGIGKTALFEAVRRRARARTVLLRVNRGEASWPLAGVSALFATIDDPRAAAVVSRSAIRSSRPPDVLAAAHDLLGVLRGLALPPTLLLVDDLDAMDPDSQLLLALLAGRLTGTGLRVAASMTRRPTEGPMAGLAAVHLTPLDGVECLQIARRAVDAPADDGVLAILGAETGGNPGVLLDQLTHRGPDELRGAEPIVLPLRPTPLTERIAAERLAGLDADGLGVLTRVALAPALRVVPPTVEEDLVEELVAARLLRRRGDVVEVRDPLVRSVLHWQGRADARRRQHAALAEALTGVDDRAATWHRSFTAHGTAIDPVVTVASTTPHRAPALALLDAAQGYLADGLVHPSVTTAERALVVGRGTSAERRSVLVLAEQLFAAAQIPLASRYLAAVRTAGDDGDATTTLRVARLDAALAFRTARAVSGDEVEALVDVHAARDPDGAATLLAAAACVRAERWEVTGTRALLDRADAVLQSAGASSDGPPSSTAAFVAATRHLVDALEGRLAPDADLHDGLAAPTLLALGMVPLALLGQALSTAERYGAARRVFAMSLAQHTAAPPVWSDVVRWLVVDNEFRAGAVRQGVLAAACWDRAAPAPHRGGPSRPYVDAWTAFADGRRGTAVAILRSALAAPDAGRHRISTARLLALEGMITLVDGHPEQAVRPLEAAAALGAGLPSPSLLRVAPDLVETYLLLGHRDDAAALGARFDAADARRPTRWGAHARLRLRALLSEGEVSVRAFRAALAPPGSAHDAATPLERARTLAAFARRCRELGATEESDRVAAAAAAAYATAGVSARGAAAAGIVAEDGVPRTPTRRPPGDRSGATTSRTGPGGGAADRTTTTGSPSEAAGGAVPPDDGRGDNDAAHPVPEGPGVPADPVRPAAGPAAITTPRSPASPDAGGGTIGSSTRRAVLDLLTPDEQAVARMVSSGYRNREIAATLFISQRTVELRLTNIYRKVGARSRSHLAALLA